MAAPRPGYFPPGAFGSPGLPPRSPVLATPLQPQQQSARKRTHPSAEPTPIVLHTVERGSLHATAHVPTRAPLGSLPATFQRYTATVKFESGQYIAVDGVRPTNWQACPTQPAAAAAAGETKKLSFSLDPEEIAHAHAYAERFGIHGRPVRPKAGAGASPAAARVEERPLNNLVLAKLGYGGHMMYTGDVLLLVQHYERILSALSTELAAAKSMINVMSGVMRRDGARGPGVGAYSQLSASRQRAVRAKCRPHFLKEIEYAGGTRRENTFLLRDILSSCVCPKQGQLIEHRTYTSDAITILATDPGLKKALMAYSCRERKPTPTQWVRMSAIGGVTQRGVDILRPVLGQGVGCGHSTQTAAKADQLLHIKGALLLCACTSVQLSDAPLDEQREAQVEEFRRRKAELAEEKAELLQGLKDGTFQPPQESGDEAAPVEANSDDEDDDDDADTRRQEIPHEVDDEADQGEGYGVKAMVDTLQTLTIVRLRNEVILPGSLQQGIGVKYSYDAATHNGKSWTTSFTELKCVGVTEREWGRAAVEHQLHKPQSPDFVLPSACFEGKDNAGNLGRHFKPQVQQALDLSGKEQEMDFVSNLPPDLIRRAASGRVTMNRLPLASKGVGGTDFRGKKLQPQEGDVDDLKGIGELETCGRFRFEHTRQPAPTICR